MLTHRRSRGSKRSHWAQFPKKDHQDSDWAGNYGQNDLQEMIRSQERGQTLLLPSHIRVGSEPHATASCQHPVLGPCQSPGRKKGYGKPQRGAPSLTLQHEPLRGLFLQTGKCQSSQVATTHLLFQNLRAPVPPHSISSQHFSYLPFDSAIQMLGTDQTERLETKSKKTVLCYFSQSFRY